MTEHKVVILSHDAEVYQKIILGQGLKGLSIETCQDVEGGSPHLKDCDIIFGTPEIVSRVLHKAPRLKWVQSMWARGLIRQRLRIQTRRL